MHASSRVRRPSGRDPDPGAVHSPALGQQRRRWLQGRASRGRRGSEHARTRAYHVTHDLEANAFFVALARASAPLLDQGLYHWVGERGCWRAYQEAHELGPIPDGWGRYLLPEGEIIFFLEWDRGTVPR